MHNCGGDQRSPRSACASAQSDPGLHCSLFVIENTLNASKTVPRKRNRIHKQAKTQNTVNHWSKFRKLRNEVTSLIRKSKFEYKHKLIIKINENNVTAKTWFKLAKQITSKHSSSQIPPLIVNGIEASTDIDKTETLNDYFCQQSSIDDINQQLPHSVPLRNCSIESINISPINVRDAISTINPSKASGPDLISPRLLREASLELSDHCLYISPDLLNSSYFPTNWKLANVAPIFKREIGRIPRTIAQFHY